MSVSGFIAFECSLFPNLLITKCYICPCVFSQVHDGWGIESVYAEIEPDAGWNGSGTGKSAA